MGRTAIEKEGRLELVNQQPPALWYRVVYFVFGYAALICGVYLLINGIMYSGAVRLH